MSDYPMEVWLVWGKDGLRNVCIDEEAAQVRAKFLDGDSPETSPHIITHVTPEWKKPEEQTP